MTSMAHPLIEGNNGDTYFQGDLEAGKALVEQDEWIKVEQTETGWRVELCYDEAMGHAAEWGAGKTLEEAYRYAIGAALGPIDEEYDESGLIANLQVALALREGVR